MDPDTNLAEQVRLARALVKNVDSIDETGLQALIEYGKDWGVPGVAEALESISVDAQSLADRVIALTEWTGFAPQVYRIRVVDDIKQRLKTYRAEVKELLHNSEDEDVKVEHAGRLGACDVFGDILHEVIGYGDNGEPELPRDFACLYGAQWAFVRTTSAEKAVELFRAQFAEEAKHPTAPRDMFVLNVDTFERERKHRRLTHLTMHGDGSRYTVKES